MSAPFIASANTLPYLVNSDAFEIREQDQLKSCGVMIIANSIDGGFISSVIKLNNRGNGYETEYIVSTGTLEYRTGSETFDYVEEAWLQSGNFDTRGKSVASRGPDVHAFKGVYSDDDAVLLYKSLFVASFSINMITPVNKDILPYVAENAFDQFTQQSAQGCITELLAKTLHGG
jgi:hypothetical protein